MVSTKVNFPPVNHIEIRDGQAYIAERTVKVRMVISRLFHGTRPDIETVMAQYRLTRAQVHAIIACYYDHQAEIDAYFDAEDQAAATLPDLADLKHRMVDNE